MAEISKFAKAFVRFTGPELATQEAMYGFIMALIFITSAQVGLISYSSPMDIVALIVGMNFVWGVVDMYVFYKMDVTAHRRYVEVLSGEGCCNHTEHYLMVYDALGSTIVDALAEEDKEKVVDLVMNGRIESREEMREGRRAMLLSAVSCFLITLLTTVPLVLCLALVEEPYAALWSASTAASVCLFFAGYLMEPSKRRSRKILTGASIMTLALALTLFAAYLGG
ncbi:MAG: hypothetical protein LBG62_00920 [Candidatus Methanoplasma sp.]|jgi:hypothetical protein|nr:hypothetical protein [Candidatus Methanoplasma sp.]